MKTTMDMITGITTGTDTNMFMNIPIIMLTGE